MSFLAPSRLWLLAAVLGLAVAYVVLQRRRWRYAVRFTSLDLLDAVAPRRPGWRRHVAAAAVGVGISALVVGLARPVMAQEETSPPSGGRSSLPAEDVVQQGADREEHEADDEAPDDQPDDEDQHGTVIARVRAAVCGRTRSAAGRSARLSPSALRSQPRAARC